MRKKMATLLKVTGDPRSGVSDVQTTKQVAAPLKLAEETVYAIAQAGEIPAFKIRGQWRIRRIELDQWIDAQPRGGDGGKNGE